VQSRLRRSGARASFAALAATFAVELTAPSALGTQVDAGPPSAAIAAEEVAAQAYDLHAAGRFSEAITAYLKAYELSNAGVALFNVATIYDRKLHERALASEYYRRYLASSDAEPDLVDKASARLTALEQDRDADADAREAHETGDAAPAVPAVPIPVATASAVDAAAPAGSAAPHASASRSGSPWKTIGLVVAGTGVATVGAGLVLGALAMVKDKDANMMCNGAVCAGEDGVRLAQESGTLATASTIVFFAGLALAGGGLTIVLAAPKSTSAVTSQGAGLEVSPQAGPKLAGLSLHGGF
jgi:hypothetical protein